MINWVHYPELLGYGAFCLGGGLFVGWIWWGKRAPRKSKRTAKSGPLYGRGR